jgi:hypothetical protein
MAGGRIQQVWLKPDTTIGKVQDMPLKPVNTVRRMEQCQ